MRWPNSIRQIRNVAGTVGTVASLIAIVCTSSSGSSAAETIGEESAPSLFDPTGQRKPNQGRTLRPVPIRSHVRTTGQSWMLGVEPSRPGSSKVLQRSVRPFLLIARERWR